jgi:hypothetical protein
MTTNQSLTEDNMSDQVTVENKIHIQTLINPDPDFLEENEKPNLNDLIEYYLMFKNNKFSDAYNGWDLQDQIKNILYDSDDDKIGRIKDLYDAKIKEIAKEVVNRYNNGEQSINHWAGKIYAETIKSII